MKFLWNYIHNMNISVINRARLFLLSETIFFALTGHFLRLRLRFIIPLSKTAMILFTLCPGFLIGTLGGLMYLYKNDI